jgi:hypothetical protein
LIAFDRKELEKDDVSTSTRTEVSNGALTEEKTAVFPPSDGPTSKITEPVFDFRFRKNTTTEHE